MEGSTSEPLRSPHHPCVLLTTGNITYLGIKIYPRLSELFQRNFTKLLDDITTIHHWPNRYCKDDTTKNQLPILNDAGPTHC